jgi:hypothetical protein
MKSSEITKSCEIPLVIGRVEKIPACSGTTPNVVRVVANEAQNTSQCLYKMSKNSYALSSCLSRTHLLLAAIIGATGR